MATIATDVQWGSGPNIYFDFSYEKKRDGATQYYKVTLSCDALQGSSYFGYPIYVQILLDGVSKATNTLKNASPSQWGSAITYTTGWLGVSNKTSGTTALKIRIYSGLGSSRDSTYDYKLAIDPAASTITCSTADIGSNPTIRISRASTSFTHTITYAFGKLTGTIAEKTSSIGISSWRIPDSFYAEIPNAKTGEGTLTCTTYSGDTKLGSNTCKLSVTTDETKCKPTVSGTVVDTNSKTIAVTGNPDVLVRYRSKALCTIDAKLNKNADSMLTKTINSTAITGDTLEIPNVEVGTFDFYAKDSREYHNDDREVKTLVPYIVLTANVTAWRVDPTSGNAKLKIEGNYFKGNFGATDNALTVQYRQGVDVGDVEYIEVTPTISDNNTYSVTVDLSGLDYTKAFDFEVFVFDKLSTVGKTVTIQKGIPVFDWGEDDFNFNVPVTINGVNILEKLAELERLVKG